MPSKTIAAIGYSSAVSRIFVEGLLAEGLSVRMLTRDPDALAARYPQATPVRGSLMNRDDVAHVLDGVDAAVVLTPGAQRNDPLTESRAAAPIIAGAREANLQHLIYTSVIAAESGSTGVGRHDGKIEVERQLTESGLPHSILRCATYMEDFFDPRVDQIRRGFLLFPVTKERRFNFTAQKDFAPFIARELLAKRVILNRPIDFVTVSSHSVRDLEASLTQAAGRRVRITPKFPIFYLLVAAGPYFRWRGSDLGWIMPMVRYWDRYGNVARGESVRDVAPDFGMTSVDGHLASLLSS